MLFLNSESLKALFLRVTYSLFALTIFFLRKGNTENEFYY